jgi:hypothetical protein
MTMTFFLILITVAHDGDGIPFGEGLEKTQGKLLTVIFNSPITLVDRSALKKFFAIPFTKFLPTDTVLAKLFTKFIAWSQTCHPDIVS